MHFMKIKISGRFFPLLLLCCALLAFPVRAEGDGTSSDRRFTLSGFGTLGLARSDGDTAEFVRDLSQPRGLTRQWSGKIDSVLGLQAITRYRFDGSHDPEISWAFLRHDFTPDFQVRVGRLGTEFYMLADSRLIGYSNTTVRPPPDFYGPLVFSYFDGADVTASTNIGEGLLRAKLFYGQSPETTAFYEPVTWNLDGSRLRGGHLDYFTGPWQFRIARAEVKFSSHELPLNHLADLTLTSLGLGFMTPADIVSMAPELSTIGTTSRFDSLGIVYDKGPLQIQSMLGRIRHESKAYEDSRAAFIIGSYRVGRLTPYLGYSTVKSEANTLSSPLAPPFDAIAAGLMATPRMNQHTVTLGTRWDFHQNWAMKIQLDMIRGKQDSAFLFRGPTVQWDGRMNVLSATLDFAF